LFNKPFFILAPMDDVTETVFRRVVADCAAPDFTMTEFVNVDGLCSVGRPKLIHKLDNSLDTATVIAQIWGKKPENFETIAREIADGTIAGFCGVDLNFGCPDKTVLKNECCSALQQPELRGKAIDIVIATQKGLDGRLPLSIKTRLGFSETDYSWHELLLQQKPAMLTVHVRTTRQMSKVPAQWAAIAPIVELRDKISPDTKIVLNGDVLNRSHGEELAKKYGVDGIMIGRGIFHDPYCFSPEAPEVWEKQTKEQRIELFRKHLTLYEQAYPNGERPYNPLKKFAKIYISNFEGASELREKIMNTTSIEEAKELVSSR
jgi:tRNA-dihydrouridine synthase